MKIGEEKFMFKNRRSIDVKKRFIGMLLVFGLVLGFGFGEVSASEPRITEEYVTMEIITPSGIAFKEYNQFVIGYEVKEALYYCLPLGDLKKIGLQSEWDAETENITITEAPYDFKKGKFFNYEGKVMVFNLRSDVYTVNGEVKKLPMPIVVYKDRSYVPIRFLLEELPGGKVEYLDRYSGSPMELILNLELSNRGDHIPLRYMPYESVHLDGKHGRMFLHRENSEEYKAFRITTKDSGKLGVYIYDYCKDWGVSTELERRRHAEYYEDVPSLVDEVVDEYRTNKVLREYIPLIAVGKVENLETGEIVEIERRRGITDGGIKLGSTLEEVLSKYQQPAGKGGDVPTNYTGELLWNGIQYENVWAKSRPTTTFNNKKTVTVEGRETQKVGSGPICLEFKDGILVKYINAIGKPDESCNDKAVWEDYWKRFY